ncbi:MAG: C39 family peptidase [Acidobacteria bacterium]|nr:C39 family peptidase [Acidobacteriota bacterium]
MNHRAARFLTAAVVALTTAAWPGSSRAQSSTTEALRLLDVPFLPQSEALCGGAATAMVMRYWGATGVYAETFSSLVDRDAGGIRGDDLLRDLVARGWQAVSFTGDAAVVRGHLERRRPVIALIEDRPGRFHYVVIVGWHRGRVIAHDPARVPFRIFDEAAFTRAWSRGQYWTLLALPGKAGVDVGPDTAARQPDHLDGDRKDGNGCTTMVDESIRLAGTGDLDAARALLHLAADTCPRDPAPWRELAGLHALKSEWPDAAADAREALARDPADEHAIRILATSLFLEGSPAAALDAWNRVGEPAIDLIRIDGLAHTRYTIAARALGLHPKALLTSAALARAGRRLDQLPAVLASTISYRPGTSGGTNIDAAVVERPLAPVSRVPLIAIGLRALTDRELALSLGSVTGGGEMWTASWRWWRQRPRVAFGLAAPAWFGGVWNLQVFDDRQTYGTPAAETQERRSGASLALSDWITPRIRLETGLGVDRWRARGTSVATSAALVFRGSDDRTSLEFRGAAWAGDARTWSISARSEWRSSPRNEGPVWVGRAGYDAAGDAAPLAVWPGAGPGTGRDVLLRAHALLHDGVIRDAVFGRTLQHANAEWRQWRQGRKTPLRYAPALFIDLARASRGAALTDRRLHTDAGVGLRIALPGDGMLRMDVAKGLRDGETVFSFGWTR